MADQRLRELRRRWRATGDAELGAGYLRECVRCGEVTEAEVQLGAQLGDPVAFLALDRPPLAPTAWEGVPGSALKRWAWRLERWGRETHVRAAVAAVERTFTSPGGPLAEALALARRHAVAPVASGAALELFAPLERRLCRAREGDVARALCWLVRFPHWLDDGPPIPIARELPDQDAHTADLLGSVLDLLEAAGSSPDALRAAIREALLPWSGAGDAPPGRAGCARAPNT